jgi:uncharacterized protein YkwD
MTLAILFLFLISSTPTAAPDALSQIASRLPPGMLEEYTRLNEEETRYAEYADDNRLLVLKLSQLSYINASRRKYGVQPVKLDILASRVANRMAREAVEGGFMGHWNTRGEKPYQRYALAGGTDHVTENAAARRSTAPFDDSVENYAGFMAYSHDSFMAEKAPNDGHKLNVIEKEHNCVGIGSWIEGKEFRYYEEYVDRYLEISALPQSVSLGDNLTVRVKPLDPARIVYAVIVYWEPLPAPTSVAAINSRSSYPDYTEQSVATFWPWDLKKDAAGLYSIKLPLAKKGSYYVQIYLDNKPFSGGGADTRGKTQGSGLVVFVR